jgi:hypothetical protein
METHDALPCFEDVQQYEFGGQTIAVSQVKCEVVLVELCSQSLVGRQCQHQVVLFLKIQPSSQVESAHSQAQTERFQLFSTNPTFAIPHNHGK